MEEYQNLIDHGFTPDEAKAFLQDAYTGFLEFLKSTYPEVLCKDLTDKQVNEYLKDLNTDPLTLSQIIENDTVRCVSSVSGDLGSFVIDCVYPLNDKFHVENRMTGRNFNVPFTSTDQNEFTLEDNTEVLKFYKV